MSGIVEVVFALAIAHFVLANVIALILVGAASRSVSRRWQQTLRPEAPDLVPSPLTLPLSVIVPAFNEEAAVVDAVLSILNSGVTELEVIVVDDGSTDDTAARLIARFDLARVEATHLQPLKTCKVEEVLHSRAYPNLWLIRKQNGGKADSVNAGVNLARFRYILMTDADSIFEPGALPAAMTEIGFDAGAHVGAGGMIRVRNGMKVSDGRIVEWRLPSTMLGQFQVAEYLGAMAGSRAGWNFINGVPVLSGAFSIWRRDVVLELGGMSRETTHEDIEFTFRVHEHFRRRREPYVVTMLSDAVIWTEVPHRWRDLYAQRKRWQRVVFECVWRYRRMIANPKYGEFGTITMPYMLLFEALGPFVEVVTIALVVFLFFQGLLSVQYLALFLVFSAALVGLTRIAAIVVDTALYRRFPPRALIRLALVALLELFLYRPIILIARIMAFPEFLTGRKTWERARREPAEVPANA
jgi:cellulose synthase/poly-beta-1,6-N-acetylglucosamine synthase-like glycosyltransferase